MIILKRKECDEYWMSLSDMMAGLMMIFLLIAVLFVHNIQSKAKDLDQIEKSICSQLSDKFKNEKLEWKMSICEDGLLVSFENDSVFDKGESNLKEEFKTILAYFIPQFMEIVMQNKEDISELRIEGHTSSEFFNENEEKSYIFNTKLSQDRSFNVLQYTFNIITQPNQTKWLTKHLTANGLSSSKLFIDEDGVEDKVKSRRVDFRVQTTATENLLNALKDNNND